MNNNHTDTVNGTHPTNGANSTYHRPAECRSMNGVLGPGPLSSYKNWAAVPLYQGGPPTTNYAAMLAECCQTSVWILSDPKPCTAVCNSTSSKQAQEVGNCLSMQPTDYIFSSGGVMQAPPTKSALMLFLVSGLLLSRMLL